MTTPCAAGQAHSPTLTPTQTPKPLAPRWATSCAILAAAAGAALAAPAPETPDPVAPRTRTLAAAAADVCTDARLDRLMRTVAAQASDPGAAMLTMRLSLMNSHSCFAEDATDAELAEILAQYMALPPVVVFEGGLRFISVGTVWTGNVTNGASGRAQRASLTYSFVPDTASWDGAANTLNASLTQNFGPGNEDRGKEFMRQALASWRYYGGLNYQEVADNGSNRSNSMTRSSSRGDIRIGGNALGTGGTLAYNYFPSSGGDMLVNTSYFNPGSSMGNGNNNYRYLRNVIAHEHGHGLGFNHVVPCNQTKLMEPFLSTAFDMLTPDERRAAGGNYGDRFSGNNSAATAVDFGDLASPILRSVIERDLSTNGQSGTLGTNADWYRFTLSSPQPVTITAAPTGGFYPHGAQASGCEGAQVTLSASQAGNLNIELRNSTGATVLQSAAAAANGQVETLSAGTLPAGTYVVRIFDAGPNDDANQRVQLYDMTIRVASAPSGPKAVAGINKRIAADTNCYFMGNINSRTTEPGATISASGYAWDLDGDGLFEVINASQISRRYPSNGVYNVTLRVTDSSGLTATDTITVTVFGAATTLTAVTPPAGLLGQTVPVVITGTNLKNVTNLNMIGVTGGGITLTGTPTPNALGTEVTGVSFVVSPSAATGPRNVSVVNADGSATLTGAFVVEEGQGCAGDWNDDGLADSADISSFLTDWIASVSDGTLAADFNADGVTNSGDIAAFLSSWLEAVSGGC